MKTSPTQRSLALMRNKGFHCEVVERWNHFSKRKNDLFGFIDILCLGDGVIVGVQTTSSSNMAARVTKIRESKLFPLVKAAGITVMVHGWVKRADGWEAREAVL